MATSRKYIAPKDDDKNFTSVATKTDSDGSPNPANDREIDLSTMNEQDIRSLRKSDPFMYYSIPGVIKAALNVKEVDFSDVTRLSRADPQPLRSSLLHEQAQDGADANKVSKKTRVSFECHASVAMDDVMEELDREFNEVSIDVDIVDLMASIRGDNINASNSSWVGATKTEQ